MLSQKPHNVIPDLIRNLANDVKDSFLPVHQPADGRRAKEGRSLRI